MKARGRLALAVTAALTMAGIVAAPAASASGQAADAVPIAAEQQICADLFAGVYDLPSSEPLARCQWDMSLINADTGTWSRATGAGVRVGVLDTGVDLTHPDIVPNLDLADSCSFVRDDDPAIVAGLADPVEAGNGDCSNKAAIDDAFGHGTHVASTLASPVNGIGVAGVAPDATIVALKACTASSLCFGYAVADAMRYAGDHHIDIVNMSLFADPFLYYCGNDAGQRALMRELQSAVRYAQQRGVLLVASNGNESLDLKHPILDTISPDGPGDVPLIREVGNNCRVLPAELPGVLTVSATGPVGYPGYTMNIADYSSVGGDIAAPGGDYFSATNTVQDAILAATPEDGVLFRTLDPLNADLPGITAEAGTAGYVWINGTSMAAPHVSGVAALIKELHPNLSGSALAAAVERAAAPMSCPADWEPLGPGDERLRCYGGSDGHTSFFGAGLVDAEAATSR